MEKILFQAELNTTEERGGGVVVGEKTEILSSGEKTLLPKRELFDKDRAKTFKYANIFFFLLWLNPESANNGVRNDERSCTSKSKFHPRLFKSWSETWLRSNNNGLRKAYRLLNSNK